MSEVKEYRARDNIRAKRIDKDCRVVADNRPRNVKAGDYLVYDAKGAHLVDGKEFEKLYREVEGDSEFHPAGNTVENVVEFLKANPDQVDRVKAEEKKGANRKGIVEFA